MNKDYRAYVWAVGLGLLTASSGLAAGREMTVGADGEVFVVHTGTYGELFPDGRDYDRSNSVVSLDIMRPDSPLQRILVPGTGNAEVETSPSILFEENSNTAYLLWGTKRSSIHPILQIAGFDGASWSRPVDVIGNSLAAKTSPQFTITRDSFDEPGPDASPIPRHRVVLHVVWREETPSGAWVSLYSPIPIINGRPAPWNPVYNLDDYLQDRIASAAEEVQSSLSQAPMVETGHDQRTILIAYTSTVMGKVAVIEVDVLPEQLTRLADAARSHIIDLGQALYPSDLATLAEKARSHIIDLGHAFRAEVVQGIAHQVKDLILAGSATGLESLADKARSHIIDLGAQLSGRGLRGVNGADATTKLVEIDPDENGSPEFGRPLLFQLRVVSDLPVPVVGPGAVRLFASESGDSLIVSWAQPDRVLYRNSRNGRWSEPRELRFSGNLDLAKAYEILEQRLRNR